jgi:hypothetical protein
MHEAAQFARWSLGMQGIVNAKVWNPSKATDEVDVSPPGIGIHPKEQRQSTCDDDVGNILIISPVCVH